MYPFAQTLSLGLPKILPQSTRRHLHHLSPATTLCRKSDRLLCPSSWFTNSARCFSEEFLKSHAVASATNALAQNQLVYAVQEKLIAFHDISGLPWWAVIVTSTIAVRSLLVFPAAAHQQYIIARLANVQNDLDTTVKEEVTKSVAKLAAQNNWDEAASDRCYHQQMKDRRFELYRKYNCHPAKNALLVFIQVPIWLAISGAIRNIGMMLPVRDAVAVQAFLEMKASGFSILKDLTVPDETYLLPVLTIVTNLIIIQLNEMSRLQRRSILRTTIMMSMRLFSVLTFPFLVYVPKCMTLYWLTSSLVGLLQNIIFIHPKTRKMLRIPRGNSLRKDPFAHIKNRFKSIYYFFKY